MSIDAWRGGTSRLKWPRWGAGDSLVAVAASTHGRRRGEALAFFFFFSPRRTVYVQLGVKMIVFQGVVMVSPAPHAARASLFMWFPRRILGHNAHSEG